MCCDRSERSKTGAQGELPETAPFIAFSKAFWVNLSKHLNLFLPVPAVTLLLIQIMIFLFLLKVRF
jgi:hypothetical protein